MGELLLAIVSGPPAAGKTYLAGHIAALSGLPMVSKDAVKETLFDAIGFGGREASRRLGLASYRLIDQFACQLLVSGTSLVMEGNFDPAFYNQRIADWQQAYGCRVSQLYC
jgi:predicted kinase